jgi:hypothetical protein
MSIKDTVRDEHYVLRCDAVWYTNVSEERTSSIFRMESKNFALCLLLLACCSPYFSTLKLEA